MTLTTLAPITNIDAVLATLESTIAPATRKAYEQELTTLHSRYAAKGWSFYPTHNEQLDSTLFTQQVLSYLEERKSEGVTVSTLNKTLSAMKWDAARTNSLAVGLLSAPVMKQFMSGATRLARDSSQKQAHALTVEQLTTLNQHLSHSRTLRAIRDRALINLGIAAALRASSLAELRLKDVAPTVTFDGLMLTVRFSKTDQEGKSTLIPVKSSTNTLLDPVRAVREWLACLKALGYDAETTPDTPLFPTMRGQQVQGTEIKNAALTLTKMLRDALVAADIVPLGGVDVYSSHSLRATFITLSSQAGVALESVAKISGHKSMAVLQQYDRTSIEAFAQTSYLGT